MIATLTIAAFKALIAAFWVIIPNLPYEENISPEAGRSIITSIISVAIGTTVLLSNQGTVL